MKLNKLLKNLFLSSSLVFWSPIIAKNIDYTKNYSSEIINISQEDLNKINRTIELIWEIEYNNFLDFFWIRSYEFVKKVKEIQEKNWLKKDWIIWPKTLEIIYKNYYKKNLENCNKEIQKRWKIYLEMKQYSKKYSRWIKPNLAHLNVFSRMFYYWDKSLWINIKNTAINKKLFWKVPENIEYKWDKIIIQNIWWKTTLSFYRNWELKVLTYITPWKLSTKSFSNRKIIRKKIITDKYHTSRNDKRTGAIMPYWIFVWGRWIWIHWSDHKINWKPASGWCYRVPAVYQTELYKYINNWNDDWNLNWFNWKLIIDIKKIY